MSEFKDALAAGMAAGKQAFDDGFTVEKYRGELHPGMSMILLIAGDACFPVFVANNIASFRRTTNIAKLRRELTVTTVE